MVLKGQIKVFGVADIIQLISQQQKTGVLCVEKELAGKVEIRFLNGNIIGAKPSEYKTSSPLGEMLVSAKLLSHRNRNKVLKEQQKTFEYLGKILVREGLAPVIFPFKKLISTFPPSFFSTQRTPVFCCCEISCIMSATPKTFI